MFSKEGKDKYKYDKIYQKNGVLKKNSKSFSFSGTYEDFRKNNIEKKWEKYGHSNEGKIHYKRILELKPKSIIDIGCGGNEFCLNMKRRKRFLLSKRKFIGVDISSPYADIIAPAHNIPTVGNKEFDLLTSFDCIEHIPKEEIEASFEEFRRISKRVFLQICLEFSPTTIDNEELHVSIFPEDWWLNLANKFFDIAYGEVEGSAKFNKELNRVDYQKDSRVRELIIIGDCK